MQDGRPTTRSRAIWSRAGWYRCGISSHTPCDGCPHGLIKSAPVNTRHPCLVKAAVIALIAAFNGHPRCEHCPRWLMFWAGPLPGQANQQARLPIHSSVGGERTQPAPTRAVKCAECGYSTARWTTVSARYWPYPAGEIANSLCAWQ